MKILLLLNEFYWETGVRHTDEEEEEVHRPATVGSLNKWISGELPLSPKPNYKIDKMPYNTISNINIINTKINF